MSHRLYTRLVQIFLIFNSLFWLPWGLVCLLKPEVWSGQLIKGMDVFDLSSAVARTEVRAMYGGLQMAIGVFALVGAFVPRHRRSVLLFFVLGLFGLASCRFAGMVIEGDRSYLLFAIKSIPSNKYNQVSLAMYELPNLILGVALLMLRPRKGEERPAVGDDAELERLREENVRLRQTLEAAGTGTSSSTG